MLKKSYPSQFVELSPLFVYYNTRVEEDTVNEDSGAYLRNALRALGRYGVCSEDDWPYDVSKFNVRPSGQAYINAENYRIKEYKRIIGLNNILGSLNQGLPVVTGLMVYSEFENITSENLVLSVPSDSSKILGGHALLLVGYSLPKQQFLAQNSFGSSWGQQGYFWIPFEYLQQELTDAWTFDIKVKIDKSVEIY